MSGRGFRGDFLKVVILAGVYFAAGKVGLGLAVVNPSVTAVWPPTGIALAALLVLGYRVWPGILLGAFLVNVTTTGVVATSVGIAFGNTLEGLVGAYLVNRFAAGRNAFDRAQDVLRFAVFAGVVVTTVGATVGVTSLSLGGLASWADYGSIWLTWWLGDAVGAVVVAPFLILWSADPNVKGYAEQIAEAVCLILGLVFVGVLVLGLWPSTVGRQTPAFLCLPFLVWAACRFGQRGAATATFIYLLSTMAVWGGAYGRGPSVIEAQHESVLWWQVFMGLAAVMSTALAAVVSELRAMRTDLERRVQERTRELTTAVYSLQIEMTEHERAEKKFRGLLESAPDAMIIVNPSGRIVLMNAQAERLFGYSRDDLVGEPVENLIPEDFRHGHSLHRTDYFDSPHMRPMGAGQDLYGLRKDGSKFPVEISLSPLEAEDGTLVSAAIRNISERKQTEAALRQLSSDLLRIQDEERRRIARELHDGPVQDLASALMDLSVVQKLMPRLLGRPQQALNEACFLTQKCTRELRTLSYLLHPPLLDELGVGFALRQYVEGFAARSGIEIKLDIADDLGRLPKEIELCLFRVTQEALMNIHHHSGSATASVRIHRNHDQVTLEVRDRGKGIPAESVGGAGRSLTRRAGLGIPGMIERVHPLGGELQILAAQPGTLVRVMLSLSGDR